MTNDLEMRVRRIEDRWAISDLIQRYAIFLDDRRYDDVGALFTVDGVFTVGSKRLEGRAAIIDYLQPPAGAAVVTWHDPHGSIVTLVDDDHARGAVVGYAEMGFDEGTVATSVRYYDDYTRVDGTWLFASRQVQTLYAMTTTDLAQGGLAAAERVRWPGRTPKTSDLPHLDRRFDDYLGR